MPIKPENLARYPADWKRIATAIKDRAGWRCECEGECATGHAGRCVNEHHKIAVESESTVVLTTAHLNHQPEDCRPENLKAMCQKCHLGYDQDHHQQTAYATRREGRAVDMFEMEGKPL